MKYFFLNTEEVVWLPDILLAPQLQHMVRLWWIFYQLLPPPRVSLTVNVSAGGDAGKGSCCGASVRHAGVFFECTEPAAVLKRGKAAGTETFMLTRNHTEQAALDVCFLAFLPVYQFFLNSSDRSNQLSAASVLLCYFLIPLVLITAAFNYLSRGFEPGCSVI